MPPSATSRPSAALYRLADLLLEANKIDQAQHEAAITHMNRLGGRIEEALLEVNALSEADLLKFIAAMHKTRFVSTEKLAKADIDRLTLDKVPRKFAEQHQIFPVLYDVDSNALSVVTPDPNNLEALRELQLTSNLKDLRTFVARPAAVKAAISKSYGGDIHAFGALDRSAHQQFSSMLNVYERNLLSDEQIARDLADSNFRERTLSAETLSKNASGRGGGAGGGVTTEGYLETLNVLVSLIENTRADLRGHSSHVARLTRKLCERVGLGPNETGAIVSAAYLHDLGKMGAYHLTALNVSEYEGHRVAAEKTLTAPRRLMEGCGLPESTFAAVETMYERYDGSGLPGQSRGKDIPLGGRLLSIADTFADLTQNPRNPFRKTLRPLEACDVLGRYKDTIFDPNLVDLFKLTITGDDVKGRLLGDRRMALLVDPDPEETTVLELRMVQQGFLVKIARGADQAVKVLESGEIEVVISELDLGGGADGFALLEEARKHPWGKDMPWVILTRRQGRQDPQRAFGLNVLDFIAKPANSDLLIAKVKQMLDQRATKTGPRGVSGSLTEMGLPDIVQVLWHGRKSGTLRIKGPHDTGEIHFVDGQIYNALWGKLRGEEAFYAMLLVQEGDFALLPHNRAPARVIEETPEALLLEGMRRMDEGLSAQG